jgi:hopanoid biosynthesis associated protein HpnK
MKHEETDREGLRGVPPPSKRQLIVNGDDFGLTVPLNRAVELAHRDGILTSASLMVGAEAAADAVERARRLPSLRVGLHIALVQCRPVLPPERIPALVTADGEFPSSSLIAGLRFSFVAGIRRQLEAEIEAQFRAFQETGLPLDHVNTHTHLHLHPKVLSVILEVGQRFGMRALRLPYEPPAISFRTVGARRPFILLAGPLLAVWTAQIRRRIRRRGLRCNDTVLGLSASGAMDEETVLRLLAQLPDGVSEMYFHPATQRSATFDRFMPTYRPLDELAALTSDRVRQALAAEGIRPVAFSDLA